MGGAVMQVNERVGQLQQGTRLPEVDRAFDESRRRSVTRLSEGTWQDIEGRKAVARTTRKPRRYGAGF